MIESSPFSKKPIAKRLLKWIGIPLGALVLLTALAPTIMPTGWIKDLIAEQSKAALGAPVTVDAISLGWFTGATLEGITVPNAKGYSASPLLKIARLHVKADLPALLSKRVQAKVTVEGLEASVERRPSDGAWNAQALQPQPSEPKPTAAPAPFPYTLCADVTVDGKLTVLGNGHALEVKDLHLDVSAPDLMAQPVHVALKAKPAAWTLDLTADAKPMEPSGKVSVTLKGKGLKELVAPVLDLPLELEAGQVTLSADLEKGLCRVSGDVQARGLGMGKALAAELNVKPKAVLDLNTKAYTLESCEIACGPISGTVEGKFEGSGAYRLKESLRGELADLPKAVTGLIPEGASFTGLLDSRLEVAGDKTKQSVEGQTTLAGFSIRAPGLANGPKTDLKVSQKLSYEDNRLQIDALRVTAGNEDAGPLDLHLSGSVEDPAHPGAGKLDVSGTARADLAKLQALFAGYFSDLPGLDCRGTVTGNFSARGNAVKGTLDLRGARFAGGPFGTSPLDVPQARLAADLDLDTDQGLRVVVRTLEASTPFLTASLTDGSLIGKALRGTLDVQVKDLDAAVRLLRGPVPALRAYEGSGKASLHARVEGSTDKAKVGLSASLNAVSFGGFSVGRGTLKAEAGGATKGPWNLSGVSAELEGVKGAGAPLPGPVDLPEVSLTLRQASFDPATKAVSAEGLDLKTPVASASVGALRYGTQVEASGIGASADLGRVGALLAAWKFLPPGTPLAGALSVKDARASGTPESLDLSAALAVDNLRFGKLTERAFAVEGLAAHVDLTHHRLALKGPLTAQAPGLGLTKLSVTQLAVGDWTALTGLEARGVELDLDSAPALEAARLFSPALAGVSARGPISLRAASASGELKRLSFDVGLDAGKTELSYGTFRKPAGMSLSAEAKGTMTADAVALDRCELAFHTLKIPLDAGSVIPLSPLGKAKVRLLRTTVDLPSFRALLPGLKDITGSVSLEGDLEGPLANPTRAEAALGIDKVGYHYAGPDGKDIPVTAEGAVNLTREMVAVKDLVLTVGGESLKVAAEVRDPLGTPSGSLTVNGGAFDLDKLMKLKPAAAPGAETTPPPAPAAADGSPTPLLPAKLRKADLAFSIALKEIVWRGNKLSNLDSKTTLKQGHLVSNTAATVNEGPVRIALDADASHKDPPVSASVEAKDVRLDVELPKTVRYFLPVLAGGKGITGKLTLEPFRVEGHGATWEALRENLHSVQDGKLHVSSGEVQASPFFQKLGEAIHKPELGDLRFDAIDSVFSIKDKRLTNQTLVHGNQGEIRNEGWVGFDGTLEQHAYLSGKFLDVGNADATEALTDLMGEGGILTDGTIDNPNPHVDLSGAIKKRLEREAKKALGHALEGLFNR